MKTKDWFTDWFNTPYYHILYKERNDADAQLFMKNITTFLALPKTTHILDLPCGKGRHSVFLNSLGYQVTGGDLAENSIKTAKKFENDSLKFTVHDMRETFKNKYDAVFNLFTSFGYFKEDKEDLLILTNIKEGLKNGGYFVFDFLNADKVKLNLVKEEVKVVDGITFHIKREIKDGFIFKHISFFADNKQHAFTERVKYLDLKKMTSFLQEVGFTVTNVFGNYRLENYDSQTSDRLILVAK
ncbi:MULTISPECIES: class I SAM-dependent DNA methyltransferase [unclassified Polaribacter]|uniref:class I SAM-dependent DNA methyltransferase n=1 Tax=unclassified Polaribacter TaxID=196858 RepID=UPI0011BF9823|nr:MULTISPECIES: class I SAM-dependent methyltransferase [unclassified Polaribacter]TXD50797.1 class I SAM-dependent methyltransferase [Polaribacter sp. IC063]TXD57547.1 class I SAM-dependent methyltransferase [Polaribacter sp. IC066]